MFFPNWLQSISVRGCLTLALVAALSGPGAAQPTNVTPQQQQEQRSDQPVTSPEPKSAIYKSACGETDDHEEADLCEQRRMAQAAIDAVWWAAFQTKLGIGGFVAVIASLFFTGWAAVAAAKAAAAAQASVSVASDTAERQLRAYVSSTLAELRNLKIGEDVQAHVVMTNCGQTPAHDFTAWIGGGIGPFNRDLPIPQRPDGKKPQSKSVLGPNKEKHLTVFIGKLTSEQAKELEAGKLAIQVVGGATYRDIFNKTRQTNFNLYYGGDRWLNEKGVLTNAHHGNEAT